MEFYVVIGLVVVIALVVIAIVRHAGGLSAVIALLVNNTSTLHARLTTIEQRIHDRFTSIENQLGLVHQVASSPTAVAILPTQPTAVLPPAIVDPPPPAEAQPPALVADPVTPPAAPSITDVLLGVGTQQQGSSAPAAAPPVEAVPDYTPVTLDYSVIRSRDMILTGAFTKTVVNCPPTVKVKAIGPSNGGLKTPYRLTVNGVTREVDNAVESVALDVQGPVVTVSVQQSPDSQIDLWVG